MLHEIEPHRYDIAYKVRAKIEDGKAYCFCFENNQILVNEKTLALPRYEDLPGDIVHEQYLFQIDEKECWLVRLAETREGWIYMPISKFQHEALTPEGFLGATAYHLAIWYQDHRFCSSCGSKMLHSDRNRSFVCPSCGREIFPVIAPAIIVAVTDGDRLLLTKYNGRAYKGYSLIAGFVEVGETPEMTVAREVYEEAGLHVKNIRYYKSQPWGCQQNLLIGFYAELDGDSTITRDEEELSEAMWMHRDELDFELEDVSLTFDLIKDFKGCL